MRQINQLEKLKNKNYPFMKVEVDQLILIQENQIRQLIIN